MIAAPPPAALTVSPTRVVVAAGAPATLEITNHGAAATTVAASVAGYAVGLRGTPRIAGRTRLVTVSAPRVTIAPGSSAAVVVAAAAPRPEPGDHAALVLFATRPRPGAVGVSLRIGVLVVVRGAGAVVHRVVPLGLRARRHALELTVRNEGTVSERLSSATVVVRPRGGVEARELLPHTRGIVRVRLPGAPPRVAVVRILGRTYRLRVSGR